jgi:hypothetical protein
MAPCSVSANGLRLIGHHDLDGCGDAMQVLRHEHALYVGHHGVSGMGTSILDVSDPGRPRLVAQWPAPKGMHTHKVQVADGLLLINYEHFPPRGAAPPPLSPPPGMAVYRLTEPLAPERIGFWHSGGKGVHRIVYTGGRYAYLSATPSGYNDRIWMVVDLLDPTNPVEAGKWWWPGQWLEGGEEPTWPAGARYAAHHALLDGTTAYLGYDDANLVVLDTSEPSQPTVIANLQWDGGSTHTCLPLPDRKLIVATDEQVRDEPGAPLRTIRLVDIANPAQPFVVSVFPTPDPSLAVSGARFGAHNLHENRPGSYQSEQIVVATYFAAGVRVYDIGEAARPREIAHWVPEPAPGKPAAQTNDVYVDDSCRFYVSDRVGGGLAILEADDELRSQLMAAAT